MKTLSMMLVLILTATAAEANQGLATKYACVACHQAEKKLVGPSWKEVAAKYADGSKNAVQLAESIKRGGSGKWGNIPMPAQPTLSDADAQTLARWVLGSGDDKP